MTSAEMRRRAEAVAKTVGVRDEEALATHEGTAARTGLASEMVADTIPGVDLLRGNSRRIVLVTNQKVRLFEGKRFGKIGQQIGEYAVSDGMLAYDDQSLVFPDGQSVVVTSHQAKELIVATGGVLNYARANYALRRLGVQNEAGLGTIDGIVPGSTHRTAGDVIGDVVSGGGFDSKTSQKRMVLFSDENARLFDGHMIHELGPPLGVYPVGTRVTRDQQTVTFPDGLSVEFKTAKTAERVVDIAARGRAAVD
jgi:hypothetical protein